MTVRRPFALALALLALLCGAGCGGGETATLGAESDDSAYKQAKQLQKQGRESEALTSYLKVIETRGDRESAESHLEAGVIYLRHIKDPNEAIHHFRKYLEFKPTSPEARRVRELVDTAKREFARTLPGRPMEDQSVRLQNVEELERMRRENEELRAQLATLRGGGALPMSGQRSSGSPADSRLRGSAASASGPSPVINLPPANTPLVYDAPVLQPAPVLAAPPPATSRPATPAPRGATAAAPNSRAATPAGRSHTVAPKDSLWSIARQHYGSGVTGAKVRGIYEANRSVMKDEGDVKPGMTLRIP